MKKYLYLLVGLLGVGLVACSDNDDDWYEISYGQLPPKAQVFLETYWADMPYRLWRWMAMVPVPLTR